MEDGEIDFVSGGYVSLMKIIKGCENMGDRDIEYGEFGGY